ncbi:MAG: hypothetical protein IT345_15775 [Trueperaceae bacterium]|nr:hypothetical protein [Trueperaceae bacterium]
MMPRLGADGAPPALPISALLVGALAVALGGAALLLSPAAFTSYLGAPRVVALNHLFTLLCVGLVFAGTLQQLPAVMFVTKLVWPRLGWLTLPVLGAGSAAVVVGFLRGFDASWLVPGAAAVSATWLALLAQLLATAARRWPKDAGSHALILSVVFLTLAVTLGFALSGARSSPQVAAQLGYPVRLHFTVGLFGAFLLGIVGSGQKLLSMFALAKGGPRWRVRYAYLAVCAAVVTEGLAAFARLPLDHAAEVMLAVACALQVWEVFGILRRRLRRKLEAPIQRYVLAHAFLPLAGVALLTGQGGAAVVLFLVGFVGLAVSGMLVKILSFLTWTWQFAGAATGGVSGGAPLLRDLVRDELEPVITWGLAVGALSLAAGVTWRAEALVLVAGAATLAGGAALFAQACHVVLTTVGAKRRLARAAADRARTQGGAGQAEVAGTTAGGETAGAAKVARALEDTGA